MLSPIDPITADLLFTLLSSAGVLACAAITLVALPWTDAEIAATEAAADRLLQAPMGRMQIRSTR